jgi:hypothetical protein
MVIFHSYVSLPEGRTVGTLGTFLSFGLAIGCHIWLGGFGLEFQGMIERW